MLRELGIDEKTVRDINDLWEKINIHKYLAKLVPYNNLPNIAKPELEDIYNIAKFQQNEEYITKIHTFLKRHLPGYEAKIFDDLKHYILTGKHKNPSEVEWLHPQLKS